MAKIALRVYTREIEQLIDAGQTKESVAHARHILETYPKYVDAYRILGKAYLEEKLYGDAADIFQRVLSSRPDDFISHVGMSIIREDEGNLDASLWHMERAFEVQPSNQAIQDELRRLYGRRDGMQPPKVRLTRGALARMYAHGELYDQAIAELSSALAQDPQRPDLQMLLAQMFFKAGKVTEAAEACSLILNKLPFCVEANHLIAGIYRDSDREKEAQVYMQKVGSLDPYLARTSASTPLAENVPDKSVTVDRLDWHPEMESNADAQPDWASTLGESLQEEDNGGDAAPDWLSPSTDESSQPESMDAGDGPEKIPDWMASFSNGDDSNADESNADESNGSEPESQKEAIPDWIGIGSESGTNEPEPQEEANHDSISADASSGANEPEPQQEEAIPDWMNTGGESKASEPEPQQEEAIPDWVSAGGETGASEPEPQQEAIHDSISADDSSGANEPEPQQEEAIPDWMSAGGESGASEPEPKQEAIQDSMDTGDGSGVSEPDPQDEAIPESMNSVSESDNIGTSPSETEGQDTPEGMSTMNEGNNTGEEKLEPQSEDSPDWLEDLSTGEAVGEDKISSSEESSEDIPDFLKEAGWEPGNEEEQDPGELVAEEKGNAKDELAPAEIPEWMQDLQPEGVEENPSSDIAAESSEHVEEIDLLASAQSYAQSEDSPEWLKEFGESSPQPDAKKAESSDGLDSTVEASSVNKTSDSDDEGPSWLKSLDKPESAEEPSAQADEKPSASESEDVEDDMAWMNEPVPEKTEQPTASESEDVEDDMAWMNEPAPEKTEQPSASESEDVEDDMAWMNEPAPEKTEQPSASESEDVEDDMAWMKEPVPEKTEQPSASESEDVEDDMAWMNEPVLEKTEQPTASESEDVEDDIASMKEPAPQTDEQPSTPQSDDGDDEMAWLEGLAAKQGAPEEELLTASSDRTEEAPSWIDLKDEDEVASTQPEASTPSIDPPEVSSPGEEDDAMAWLEGLAAKQGADEEELSTQPEDRTSETPEWIKSDSEEQPNVREDAVKAAPEGDEDDETQIEEKTSWKDNIGEASSESLEEPGEKTGERDEELSWLDSLEEEETESPIHEDAESDSPEWLKGLSDETLSDVQDIGEELPVEAAPEWLPELSIQPSEEVHEENAPSVSGIEEPITSPTAEQQPHIDEVGEPQSSASEEEHIPVQPSTPEPNESVSKEQSSVAETQMFAEPSKPTPKQPAKKRKSLSDDDYTRQLSAAREMVASGNIAQAVDQFAGLIKRNKRLEETISDLEALQISQPNDVSIMQTLGDAYMRADRLQEALDSYSKAEELLH